MASNRSCRTSFIITKRCFQHGGCPWGSSNPHILCLYYAVIESFQIPLAGNYRPTDGYRQLHSPNAAMHYSLSYRKDLKADTCDGHRLRISYTLAPVQRLMHHGVLLRAFMAGTWTQA